MIPYAPSQHIHDVLIIGGGPGGLTAAIYLRRFRRDVILIDKGHSRLSWIPVSHNYPGFPDGVHGQDLLDNLRAQLERYDGQVRAGEVTRLTKENSVFVAAWDEGEVRARSLLLATGMLATGIAVSGP